MLLLKSRLYLSLFALFILTACGFQPLHGERKTALNTSMERELSSIWITEIEDREGQLLHNELLTRFNTKGRPTNPQYTMKIDYHESTSGLGIAKDEFATRANLVVTASFTLKGKLNFSGNSKAIASYNILTSPTGTEFAKRDARIRAIKTISADIHRKVAVRMLSQPQ